MARGSVGYRAGHLGEVAMLGFVLAQLRYRKGRALALVGALLVAVTSFSVLTGAARTQRLSVVGTVTANARGGYDILVRPAGARSALEDRDGLVASTALANLNGGITTAQWQQIARIPDVDVAAPVAVVGYVLTRMDAPVDLPVTAGGGRQLYRATMTQVSERGLTRIPAGESYTYVTDRPLRGVTDSAHSGQDPYEVDSAGAAHPVCVAPTARTAATGPQVVLNCGTTNPQDTYNSPGPGNPHASGTAEPAATTTTAWPVPLLIEAVDLASEARLAGLDKAVTWGSYLGSGGGPTTGTRDYADLTGDPSVTGKVGVTQIPVLMADRPAADEQLQVAVSRLPSSAADRVAAGTDKTTLGAGLPGTRGTPVTTKTVDVQQAYRTLLEGLRSGDVRESYRSGNGGTVWVGAYATAQPVRYGSARDGLTAEPRQPDPNLRLDYEQTDGSYPRDLDDTAVRKAVVHPAGGPWDGMAHDVHLKMVGEFDSSKLSVSSAGLGAVPMETYFPAQATGADPASVRALGGRSLLPNGNIAGLLSVPPSIVTSLSGLKAMDDARYFTNTGAGKGVNAAAPISVVRVRLTGALGLDPLSRERVRLTAQRIHDLTGLDVDITSGSSPTPVAVGDPAGTHGRPALTLHEMWSKKGSPPRWSRPSTASRSSCSCWSSSSARCSSPAPPGPRSGPAAPNWPCWPVSAGRRASSSRWWSARWPGSARSPGCWARAWRYRSAGCPGCTSARPGRCSPSPPRCCSRCSPPAGPHSRRPGPTPAPRCSPRSPRPAARCAAPASPGWHWPTCAASPAAPCSARWRWPSASRRWSACPRSARPSTVRSPARCWATPSPSRSAAPTTRPRPSPRCSVRRPSPTSSTSTSATAPRSTPCSTPPAGPTGR